MTATRWVVQVPQGEDHPAVRLGEIYQAAPDANFREFASDLQRYVPPDARGLQGTASDQNLQYGTFPPDYDKRMVAAVTKLVAGTPRETATTPVSKTP